MGLAKRALDKALFAELAGSGEWLAYLPIADGEDCGTA
jgi:hypothetical protein